MEWDPCHAAVKASWDLQLQLETYTKMIDLTISAGFFLIYSNDVNN